MTQLHVYLTFDGDCREAMHFYKQCLGGELSLQTVEESPMAGQWPETVQKHVLHASLTLGEIVLLGSDMGSEKLLRGNTISLALACSSDEEIVFFFNNLCQGGKVTHPLHKFHDGTIGALTDRYGVNWLFKL